MPGKESAHRHGNIVRIAQIIYDKMHQEGLFDNCLSCMYFANDDSDVCSKFKERPPAKIIVTGCEYHDKIPF